MVLELVFLTLIAITALFIVKELVRTVVRFYITFQGPFFAPTSDERITDLLKLVKIKPGSIVTDLGSGDGRVLIALAKKFKIKAVGYEIDPKYVSISRELIKKEKLEKVIEIKAESFWEADLSHYDVIIMYCVPRFLRKMELKLEKEAKSTTQILSVFFKFPTWKPVEQQGDILLYRKKS